jgi:hypothetical protein
MDLSLIQRLIEDNDPLQTLYETLTGEIWTAARFDKVRGRDDLFIYLREGEHAASTLGRRCTTSTATCTGCWNAKMPSATG